MRSQPLIRMPLMTVSLHAQVQVKTRIQSFAQHPYRICHPSPTVALPCAADRNAYYHPCFIRGDRDLCRSIRRVKFKGRGPRKPSRPEDQPNFYVARDPSLAAETARAAFSPGTTSAINEQGIPTFLGPPSSLALRRGSSSADASLLTECVSHPLAGLGQWSHPGLGRAHPPSLFSIFVASRTPRSPCWLRIDGSGGVALPTEQLAPPPTLPPYHQILRAAMGASSPAATIGPQQFPPSIFETASLSWDEEEEDDDSSEPTNG
jgi:hypothetical protein